MSICGQESEALFCWHYNKLFKEGKATVSFCFLFAYGFGGKGCTPLLFSKQFAQLLRFSLKGKGFIVLDTS